MRVCVCGGGGGVVPYVAMTRFVIHCDESEFRINLLYIYIYNIYIIYIYIYI